MEKKQLIIIILGIFIGMFFIIIAILFMLNVFKKAPALPPSEIPPITESPITPSVGSTRPPGAPRNSLLIPTTISQGRIDEKAPSIIASTEELKKIEPLLNYQQELVLANGKLVDIVISKRGLQETPWILPISIGGIKYQTPENESNYNIEKQAFKEASKIAFDWLTSNNVAVGKIYIRWGDKPFIQERVEKWLNE